VKRRQTITASELEDRALMQQLASSDTSMLDKLCRKHWRTIDAFVDVQVCANGEGCEVSR
jgi:hypothetical protein